MKKQTRGFSLIESLLSMSLFLVVLFCSLELFSLIKTQFFDLRQDEENSCAAFAALDRMAADAGEAGWKLSAPMRMGILEGISEEAGRLVLISKENDLSVTEDLLLGQTWVPLENSLGIKKGHEICLMDAGYGELRRVLSVDTEGLILDSPLGRDYPEATSSVFQLRKISFYIDQKKKVLRRKVNSSPAQPLLEKAHDLIFTYSPHKNLLYLGIRLENDKERLYDRTLYPKNTALAGI